MSARIGIRREDKHRWERRAPLTPEGVRRLVECGLEVVVQPSPIRVFGDAEYAAAGARIDEDLSGCDLVLAVKEIPVERLRPGGAYWFFSHTIKGQPQNMPMLRRLMELGCTLIDYERIVDAQGRRLVFFGRHAGLAGMIDTLAVLGKRLAALGEVTPFDELGLAHEYDSLEQARAAVARVGERLAREPLSAPLAPLIIGIAGYGNVSKGAQEILEALPLERIPPEQVAERAAQAHPPGDRVLLAVFEERHLVEPIAPGAPFVLAEYFEHPERYRSVFERYAPHLSVLVNAIYWTDAYPRLVTREQLARWYAGSSPPRLLAIGDISCDIEGAIECTVKATTPGEPAYVFDPVSGRLVDGVRGTGIVMMTTDTLPCELPRESSEAFTDALLPFVADVAAADFGGSFEQAGLPDPVRRATILWRGELTEDYRYLEAFAG